MIEWWTNQDSGWIGGIGGSVFGVLGAAVGACMSVLAPRGKGKVVVLGMMVVGVVVGLASLGVGIAAMVLGQPYHVWYPLTLLGGITSMVIGSLIPVARQRYRSAEQRRLDAAQIRQG
jgi:hypothetical protein